MEPLPYPNEETRHVTEFSLALTIAQVRSQWPLLPPSFTLPCLSPISNCGCLLPSLFLKLVLLPGTYSHSHSPY